MAALFSGFDFLGLGGVHSSYWASDGPLLALILNWNTCKPKYGGMEPTGDSTMWFCSPLRSPRAPRISRSGGSSSILWLSAHLRSLYARANPSSLASGACSNSPSGTICNMSNLCDSVLRTVQRFLTRISRRGCH